MELPSKNLSWRSWRRCLRRSASKSSLITVTTTDRSTFVGRAVYLAPSLAYVADPQFAWSVDGEPVVAETGAVFKFTPDGPGDYTVRVDVTEGGDASERLTRNIVRGVATLSAEIVVHALRTRSSADARRVRRAVVSSMRFTNFCLLPGSWSVKNRSRIYGQ